ncbi:MAG: PilN domain-containing protein [Desulfobacterium sp.]|nr:PilN domain-containing protein [Desulfobacterium sp.]
MALREINMIPGEIMGFELLKRQLKAWGKILVLVLMALGMTGMGEHRWLMDQRRAASHGLSMETRLKTVIQEIHGIQETLETIRIRNKTLEILGNRFHFYGVVQRISQPFDHLTWLGHLRIQGNKTAPNRSQVELEGFSMTHASLGNFINRLSAVPGVREIVLAHANQNHGTESGPLAFKLSCTVSAESEPSK